MSLTDVFSSKRANQVTELTEVDKLKCLPMLRAATFTGKVVHLYMYM